MSQQFINRARELRFLEERHATEEAEFVVLYGRRRIGKTRLITEFMRQKKGIYFLSVEYSEKENLDLLQRQMGDFLGDESFKKLRIEDLEELFIEFIKWYKGREKVIVAIDEFPFLIKLNPGIPSIFQRIWDLNLKEQQMMLILSGSSIGMMENEVLGYRSPLYGRRTGQWRLEKLDFECIKSFLPNYHMEDLIRVHGCLDGIPEYLLKFSPRLGFWENLRRNFISKGCFLYEEAEILLREEFREPRNYTFILKAVAEGNRKFSEIANASGIDKGALSRYLFNLQSVGIIEPELPATFSKKSKRSLYKIKDNYFRFYFRFVLPNKTDLEAEIDITPRIRAGYGEYLGFTFEELVRELMRKKKMEVGFSPEEIAPWWYRGEEIDIIATRRDGNILFCEVKWGNLTHKKADALLKDLRRKAPMVKWHSDKRKEHFGIIAKKIEGKEELRREGVLAYDLEDFEKVEGITRIP